LRNGGLPAGAANIMSTGRRVLLVLAIAAAVVGAALLWQNMSKPVPELPAPPPAATVPGDAHTAEAPPEPAIKYPLEVPAAAAPLAAADIGAALTELVGRKALMSFFQIDDFARRFVATVDNLGRSYAPPMLWPVHPTPGQFTVEQRGDSPVIGADNSLRYTPLVLLAEAVDTGRAVDLYVRMYPLLQRAYEELGYPKRTFNDRLIEVVDQLLATPNAPEQGLKVRLTEVKGSVPSVRPWVRYEFADPALESLSAGQKILLRVGPVNQRRLKAKLAGIRQELIKRVTPR